MFFLQCGIVGLSGHGVSIVVMEYSETAYTFSENMMSYYGIGKNLKSLKEKGLIERVGSDKAGYWKVL